MPRLSEHKQSGTIGMFKAGVHVFDVAGYHNRHPSTIHRLKFRYQGTGTVKDRHRSAKNGDCVSTIFKATIFVLASYFQCQTNIRAPRVIYFLFFNKNILSQ